MRRSAMIGSFLAGAVALAGRLFGFHPEEMPVLIKTDPKPWLPTGSKSKPAKKRKISRHVAPMNGKREVERRLRQITKGQLTRANGLRTRAELGLPEVGEDA